VKVKTNIISSTAARPRYDNSDMYVKIFRPNDIFFICNDCHNVFDVTLTDNFQYQSESVDIDNIIQ
jgi:Fe2+ or Zn2+ uptake regulation protein